MTSHPWDWDWFQNHPLLSQTTSHLAQIPPSQYCQTIYLLLAACVLTVASTPPTARTLLINYGARKSTTQPSPTSPPGHNKPEEEKPTNNTKNPTPAPFTSLIAHLTSHGQVPHSWFSLFYLTSILSSLFWLTQYLADGSILHRIISLQASSQTSPSATLSQVAVAWTMMLLQGLRRTYEHAFVMKPSKSTMWFVHWFLGLGFYILTGIAIWVEGSGAILHQGQQAQSDNDIGPLLKISIALPAFLFAWVNQYKSHKHLAGLKKYSLPDQGLFRHLLCAHYTCECLLYFSIAVAAAPAGQWCNRTLLCALIFVSVNLGVTAAGTRKWYAEKFGAGAIAGKWNMIPFIF